MNHQRMETTAWLAKGKGVNKTRVPYLELDDAGFKYVSVADSYTLMRKLIEDESGGQYEIRVRRHNPETMVDDEYFNYDAEIFRTGDQEAIENEMVIQQDTLRRELGDIFDLKHLKSQNETHTRNQNIRILC